MNILTCHCCPVPDHVKTGIGYISVFCNHGCWVWWTTSKTSKSSNNGNNKLPNFEQSYKGKVKLIIIQTDKISQQPENCENRNDPDLVQAFLKKWWVESDFKAPNLPLDFFFNKPLVRAKRYLLSIVTNISYFIVRTFDVKHHAAHGTLLINFCSEKRSYIF